MKLRDEILSYLRPGQATIAAMADALSKEPHEVFYQIRRLIADDLVTVHTVETPKGELTVYRLA